MLVLLASGAQAAFYSGGTGMEADPYQIGSAADWATLSATPVDWDKHFFLTADIDFDGATLTPVGNANTPFSGVLNGADHVLSNGQINLPATDYVGVFGCLGSPGVIRNLGVDAVSVEGKSYVGGLAGYNLGGKIISCYTTGTVTGREDYVGGLVGYNGSSGVIASCFSLGTVTGGRDYTGGLVGNNSSWSKITSCYAMGAVMSSGNYVGGLAGSLAGVNMGDSEVEFCYATGAVTGGGTELGGLVGYSWYGLVTASYWDKDTSAQSASEGGSGRTTEEMTHPYAANTYEGWDFTTVWTMDVDYRVNKGYPYLWDCPPPEGTGSCGCVGATGKELNSEDGPFRILADWLLIGLSVLVLAVFSSTRR